MSLIHTNMAAVQREVVALGIAKKFRNKAQSYDFRSVDQALNVIGPVLAKHGVVPRLVVHQYRTAELQEEKSQNQGKRTICRSTLVLDLAFTATDGSEMVCSAAGEGVDYGGDKATPKAMAMAFKYALFLGLAIPTEESGLIEDADRDVTEPPAADAKPPHKTKPAVPQPQRYSASDKDRCLPAQVERIVQIAQHLAIDPEQLKGIVRKRGVARAADLSIAQANEILKKLEEKELARQTAEAFQPEPSSTPAAADAEKKTKDEIHY